MLREQDENSNDDRSRPTGTPNRYQTEQETLEDEAEALSSVQEEEEADDEDWGSDGSVDGVNLSGQTG